MKKIFFDTNVYNHLTSKQTIELKALVTKETIENFSPGLPRHCRQLLREMKRLPV